jgi:hypothetical protein
MLKNLSEGFRAALICCGEENFSLRDGQGLELCFFHGDGHR